MGIRMTPCIRDTPSSFSIITHLSLGSSAGLTGTLDRLMSCPSEPLQYLEFKANIGPLPNPLSAMVCEYVGRQDISELSGDDVIAILQRFEAELKAYSALKWDQQVWKRLLLHLKERKLRELAVCCLSGHGIFGELVKLYGVEHVFGFNLAGYGLAGEIRVQIEFDEEHLIRPHKRTTVNQYGQRWKKERTIVRLTV